MSEMDQNADISPINRVMPRKRLFQQEEPGFINVADERGHYSGAKALWFGNVEEMNKFFEEHANLLVVMLQSHGNGCVFVLFTNVVTEEQMKKHQYVLDRIAGIEKEYDEMIAKEEKAEQENFDKAKVELEEKVRIAEHCIKNHKHNMKEK